METMTMEYFTQTKTGAAWQTWVGRILSGLVVLFMIGASVTPKIFFPEMAGASMDQLGWPRSHLALIAGIELIGTVLYAIPRTSAVGALILTGLFGGATATHLRVGNPLFSHVLFTVFLGAVMWAGLLLRKPALRVLLPWSKVTKI